jgi:AAA+ superfamily predicted ATPase
MEGFLMNRLGEWAPQTMVLMGEKGGAGSAGARAAITASAIPIARLNARVLRRRWTWSSGPAVSAKEARTNHW